MPTLKERFNYQYPALRFRCTHIPRPMFSITRLTQNSSPALVGLREGNEESKFSGCCSALTFAIHYGFLVPNWSWKAKPTRRPRTPSALWFGHSGGHFAQMCASRQLRLPQACRLAGCNMLYLGLHLRPYGPSAAAPYRGSPAARRGPDGADGTCAGPSDSTLLWTWCAENGTL